MDNSLADLPKYLAKNIGDLRIKRSLSQTQLAELAGVPRSTLTYLESGSGNPSLANLLKVSRALQVSIEELISVPRDQVEYYPQGELKVVNKSKAGVRIEKLLPDPIPGMEIDLMTLKPKSRMKGTPHLNRTKEYLYCNQGRIQLHLSAKIYELREGDLIAFPGDRPHAYINPDARKTAICFSVVAYA